MADSRTYFRVADDIDENPKMLELSNAAFRLDLHGISYCARRKTDGRVPKRMVPRLLRNATKALDELLEHGRWIDQGTHYEIHDYLEHQRSKAEIEALAKVRREAGKKGGRPKANGKAKGLANITQTTDTDTETDKNPSSTSKVSNGDWPPRKDGGGDSLEAYYINQGFNPTDVKGALQRLMLRAQGFGTPVHDWDAYLSKVLPQLEKAREGSSTEPARADIDGEIWIQSDSGAWVLEGAE